MLITLRSWVRAPAEPFFPFPFLLANEAAEGTGVQDAAVRESARSDDFSGEYIMLQSTALDQNDTTKSAEDEEDSGNSGEDPASPEKPEIKDYNIILCI